MDKELLNKYKIDEAVKRLRQINEYTFITQPVLSEDGEDDENGQVNGNPQGQQGNNGENNAQGGGMDMQTPQGNGNQGDMQPQGNPQDGQQGNGGMQQMPPPQAPMGGNQPDNQQMPQGSEDQSLNFDIDDGGQEGIETTEMEPDDEVIDVDDLTQSQEETEGKVDDVNQKLVRLLQAVDNFTVAIKQNDEKIADLKKEFEKRNPTPEERLNLRSQSNYPYSETPKDYWDKKTAENPNYDVRYNNEVSPSDEQHMFDIHQSDIDGNINYQSIADTFDKPYKLSDFF